VTRTAGVLGTWGSGGERPSRGAPGQGVKLGRRAAVPGRVTVSRDIAPARTVPDPAVPAQSARPRPEVVRPQAARPEVARPAAVLSVRRAVEALRRALDDGTVHHHRGAGVPARRRAPGVEVVRVWAAGLGVEEQRRACRTCAGTSAGH
jgi:hypothetical protein